MRILTSPLFFLGNLNGKMYPIIAMHPNPPGIFAQLQAILALPFTVLVVVPFLLDRRFNALALPASWQLPTAFRIGLGSIIGLIGFVLFVASVRMLILIGRGTLAPWNPTKRLVVRSLYRYQRNPMISGILLLLLAEAALLSSWPILLWALFFFLLNNIYFTFKEEPDLERRFGEEYREYKQNVRRWLPRYRPWQPNVE